MIHHSQISAPNLRRLIRCGAIRYAGNARLRIYGTLRCRSGRRMHRRNRVFFADAKEARAAGFRPCGHCLRADYRAWKKDQAGSSF